MLRKFKNDAKIAKILNRKAEAKKRTLAFKKARFSKSFLAD